MVLPQAELEEVPEAGNSQATYHHALQDTPTLQHIGLPLPHNQLPALSNNLPQDCSDKDRTEHNCFQDQQFLQGICIFQHTLFRMHHNQKFRHPRPERP
jgi:hypothetical protein